MPEDSSLRRVRIGQLTLLTERGYPVNPAEDPSDPNTIVGAFPASQVVPVFHDLDTDEIYWGGFGIPSRFVDDTQFENLAHVSQGMFSVTRKYHYEPTGDPAIWVQSARFSPTEFFAMLGEQIAAERMAYEPHGPQPVGARQRIFNAIETVMAGFLYYDRKESDLTVGMLNRAVESGVVTVADILGEFERQLRGTYKDLP